MNEILCKETRPHLHLGNALIVEESDSTYSILKEIPLPPTVVASNIINPLRAGQIAAMVDGRMLSNN